MTRNTAALLAGLNPLFLRLGLGTVFIVSGAGKVLNVGPKATGIGTFAGVLADLGIPVPGIAAWFVGSLELIGGVLLLVGLLTRVVSLLLAVTMFVATLLVHSPEGFAAAENGIEYTMILTLVCLALAFSGPGRLSVERLLFDRELITGRIFGGSGDQMTGG